jgi:two-component system, chemotaxis family, chemotaxis protein CheY
MHWKDLTILVVDDVMTMRRIVRNILRDLQFKNIIDAEDGAAAVRILESQKVDLIVSDWNMPVMTGLELLKWVRANEVTKNVPFLMITAEAQKDNIMEALKAKVSGYMVKPFTPQSLAEKLQRILPR